MFDLASFASDHGLYYRAVGKNIGKGWHATTCPTCHDESSHFGVSRKSGHCHCFKCGAKMHIIDAIRMHMMCSVQEAKAMYKQYNDGKVSPVFFEQTSAINKEVHRVNFPMGIAQDFPEQYRNYLINRKFDPDELIARYNLLAGGHLAEGNWRYRIIVPITMEGKLVSYVGRAILPQVEPRYYNLSADLSIIPVKQCLYATEYISDMAILCEGVTDAWRWGSGSTCTFGADLTNFQLMSLKKHGVKTVVTIYDPDPTGIRKAKKLNSACSLMGLNTFNYSLDGDKDIGDHTDDEIVEIKSEIFGRIM